MLLCLSNPPLWLQPTHVRGRGSILADDLGTIYLSYPCLSYLFHPPSIMALTNWCSCHQLKWNVMKIQLFIVSLWLSVQSHLLGTSQHHDVFNMSHCKLKSPMTHVYLLLCILDHGLFVLRVSSNYFKTHYFFAMHATHPPFPPCITDLCPDTPSMPWHHQPCNIIFF